MKRALVLAPLVLVLVPVPAYAGGGCHLDAPAAAVATRTVTIDHACFGPIAAAVGVGGTVTWDNTKSGLEHNLSGPGLEYAELPVGGTHRITFDRAGLFPYACTLHPGMSGVVVVGGASAVPDAAVETPAVQPAAASGPEDDGGSFAPVLVGGLAVAAVGALVLVTFGRRERGVPVPAR